jgi:hypothetical protein
MSLKFDAASFETWSSPVSSTLRYSRNSPITGMTRNANR